MTTTWLTTSAADLGRGIANGQIDPVELTEAFLDALAAHPQTDRIYARLTATRARAESEAARIRARNGQRRGPLDGVPVSWKDLFDSAGVATESGSALLRDRIPAKDAPVLATATRAGLVCLGKTHMSELAFSGLGLNPVTATPPNINGPDLVPGGSSSGAAASVAFGLAAAAVGSDTGGSVRIPSAWNNLVGLKTTHARIPTTGAIPLCERFDTVGPLCRTVEDCGLMLAALQGNTATDLRGATLDGIRIGILDTVALDDLRPEPGRAFDGALSRLSTAGASLQHFTCPEVAEALSLAGILVTGEAWALWSDTIEANPALMFPRILDRFRTGAGVSAKDYIQAWRRLEQIRTTFAAATAGFDLVAIPTSPILPPDAARLMSDSDYYVTENLLALRNTRIGNLIDGCGLTLPTGTPGCGILLMAPPMAEERLLRLGMAAESALA